MSQVRVMIALLACCSPIALAQATGAGTQLASQPAAVQAHGPLTARVSGIAMLGMVDHKTMPVYPDEAMKKGAEGDVIFRISVDQNGKIVLAAPVVGDPLLTAASVDAFRTFHFRPYRLNNVPVGVETSLGYHFSLEKNGDRINAHVECMTSIPDRPEFHTSVANDKSVLVVDPHKLSGPEPELPPDLADKFGSVYLKIIIGEDGKVQDASVIGGDEPFIGPVISAVDQGVYEPRLIDGKPAVSTTEASFHFGSRQ